MQRQLQTGFYSDVLLNAIQVHYKDKAIGVTNQLLHSLCFFETDLPSRNVRIDKNELSYSLLSVYHNYLQRGLPTHSNVVVEEYLKKTWGGIELTTSDTGGLEYCLTEPSKDFTRQLFSSLFIVDPRVTQDIQNNKYWRNWLGSDLERRFLNEHLLHRLGNHWIQLIEPQRSVANILSYSYKSGECIEELYNQPIDLMGEQRVDFAVEPPCVFTNEGRRGLVVEIDGSQHLTNRAQFNLDQYRDLAMGNLEQTRWAVLRARSAEWNRIATLLNNFDIFFRDKYFERIAENYKNPIWQQPDGLKALNIALTPFAVARIQKTLVELIYNGNLLFEKATWKIGIVERDVDAAWIAIEDFTDCCKRLIDLCGAEIRLPQIELTIYNTKEFTSSSVPVTKLPIEQAAMFTGDVLLDVSVLQRWGLTEPVRSKQSVYTVTIRSSHSKKELREFISAPLVRYQPLIEIKEHCTDLFWQQILHINYFVQSVFRKKSLRPGQLPIINKALQLDSVIGLLQTGGGKSLTYQICSLLQPGISIVIDPIKSLMQDQNEGLVRNKTDATVFINSSLKTHYERKWAQDQLVEGRVLFCFISPERLQIPEFKASLNQMNKTNEKYFSYCVIDEAHCVSEWGHDFRTAYLKLGENARNYCKTWQEKPTIPLFGLTATASFDVLSDVKRELQIGDENVVSNLSSHRAELIYQVHPVTTGLNPYANGYFARQTAGDSKIRSLASILANLPDQIDRLSGINHRPTNYNRTDFYLMNAKDKFDNAVLIFCPHKSGKSPAGVEYVAPRLNNANYAIGVFHGGDRSADGANTTSEENQAKYIDNKLNILVATKAFGMGIDKSNIRCTVHFNFPSSIESFIQEAGRAGRDRKRAICHILYSNDAKHIDEEIISSFHANNFRGVGHDYAMLLELLQEITYPAQRVSNQLTQKIFEDLGELVQISVWQGGENQRLYINKAFQVGYGYIDLRKLTKNIGNVHPEIGTPIANAVLDYALGFIRDSSHAASHFEWLQSEIIGNSYPGIEVVLNKAILGYELPEIEVGFRNNRINRITELLKANTDERFTENIVQSASEYCKDIDDFYANIIRTFTRYFNEDISERFPLQDKEKQTELEQYFHQIRTEIDTFKAIYRLSVLGVIDDYEVNYAAQSVKIKISKRPDEHYLHRLEDYLSRYLSSSRVGELVERAKTAQRGSVMRNIAYTLIEYVYEFIGKKRARAIKEMQGICEIGVASQDHGEIERTISLYFESKYTEDLLEKTNGGGDFSLAIVQEYLEETQGITDNLEHLKGSCARILTDNPDNGALLVLRAYSTMLLETKLIRGELLIRNQYLVDQALEDMENGLSRFEENGMNLIEVLNLIRDNTLTHNPGLTSSLEEVSILLSVKQHSKWLKKFNGQFIS